MDIRSNNEILKMYNRKQSQEKFTLGYWLKRLPRKDEVRWLKVPVQRTLQVVRNIILLVGLSLPLHTIYIASRILGKLFIRLPKRSELITLIRPSDKVGKAENLPMYITRFSRGEVN